MSCFAAVLFISSLLVMALPLIAEIKKSNVSECAFDTDAQESYVCDHEDVF